MSSLSTYGKKSKKIGQGAYGAVYLFQKGRRKYAIKIMPLTDDNEIYGTVINETSIRELSIMREIHHPNIVPLLDFKLNNNVYLITPYMEEGTLDDFIPRIRRNQPCVTLVIKSIVYQILVGLSYLHHRDIIHRDLKEDNVLVSSDPEIGYRFLITDFGMSRALSCSSPLNKTQGLFPLPYRAPEILLTKGEVNYDQKADLWTIGVIIYRLITIQYPFRAFTIEGQYQAITSILGSPNLEEWPQVVNYPRYFETNSKRRVWMLRDKIALQIPQPDLWYQMILRILQYNPDRRPTANQLLRESFFDSVRHSEVETDPRSCLSSLELFQKPIRGPLDAESIGINSGMRKTLLSMIIKTGNIIGKRPRTVFIALYLHDHLEISRYISKGNNYPLYGWTCLYLASVYNDVIPILPTFFTRLSGNAFTVDEMIEMATKILRDTSMVFSTSYDFLLRYNRLYNPEVQSLSKGLLLWMIFLPRERPQLKKISVVALAMACRYFEEDFKHTYILTELGISSKEISSLTSSLMEIMEDQDLQDLRKLFQLYYLPSQELDPRDVLEKILETKLRT